VLDPVFVEASTGNPWQLMSSPGFEILSRCPLSFNAAYARALEKADAARLAFLPARFWADLPAPIEVILYNREPDKEAGFLQGKPIDLTWGAEDGALLGSDTVQQAHPIIAGDGDTFVECGNYHDVLQAGGDFSVDVGSSILLANRLPRLPSWFISGVDGPNGVYVNRVIKSGYAGDTMVLPNALWTSSGETVALQEELRKVKKDGGTVRPRSLLPVSKLFSGQPDPSHAALWNAEAALFVRWGLYRSTDRQAFLDFVDQASRHPVNEELFRKCLGLGYEEVQAQLSAYLPVAASESIVVSLDVPPEDLPDIRGASASEVARILGDWGRLEGRASGPEITDFQEECLRQADKQFQKAVLGRVSDPSFLAAYGLYALQAGDNGRARKALEEATSRGVIRPRAYVELARIRLEDALPTIPGGFGDLNEKEFGQIKALLTTARVQMPSLMSTYSLMARVLQHAPKAPSDEDLYVLERALDLFPEDTSLAYRLATLYRRLGRFDKAAAIVERSRPFAEAEHDRTLLASFPVEKVASK
jgi:tetratricopeptide (TPR) repeat protein